MSSQIQVGAIADITYAVPRREGVIWKGAFKPTNKTSTDENAGANLPQLRSTSSRVLGEPTEAQAPSKPQVVSSQTAKLPAGENSDSESDNSSSGDFDPENPKPSDKKNYKYYDSVLSKSFPDLKAFIEKTTSDPNLILMKILTVIFEGKSVTPSDIAHLKSEELIILSCLLYKKCKIVFSQTDHSDKIAELINSHKTAYKHKRNEENYKLVFKKAIKYLARKLKQEDAGSQSKEKNRAVWSFFVKYFHPYLSKDIASRILGLEPPVTAEEWKRLEVFKQAKDSKVLDAFAAIVYNPKTVNPKYISSVSQSKKFLDEVIAYLNTSFLREYRKSRYSKIERILGHCRQILRECANDLSKSRDKIDKNPRFKLPWYDHELDKAMRGVASYLEGKCGVLKQVFQFTGGNGVSDNLHK